MARAPRVETETQRLNRLARRAQSNQRRRGGSDAGNGDVESQRETEAQYRQRLARQREYSARRRRGSYGSVFRDTQPSSYTASTPDAPGDDNDQQRLGHLAMQPEVSDTYREGRSENGNVLSLRETEAQYRHRLALQRGYNARRRRGDNTSRAGANESQLQEHQTESATHHSARLERQRVYHRQRRRSQQLDVVSTYFGSS
jgi:hypothetical protein